MSRSGLNPAPDERLARALPGWDTPCAPKGEYLLGVLPGEGVGPEMMAAALEVLGAIEKSLGLRFDVRVGGAIGLEAAAASGRVLTPDVVDFCEVTFREGGAILCGPGGGRFVYELRSRFDLYCKLIPVRPVAALADTGTIKAQATANADLVVVRENTGGLYLGEWERSVDESGIAVARQSCAYNARQVRRILVAAAGLAARRTGRLAVVLKPGGVPAISDLWCEELTDLADTGIEIELLEVDNAAYQLVAQARRFDVVVAPNMFGDVLADCASLLLGSRGMSYSGNFGTAGLAVYQTGHGAAHDLAGTDRANPAGQILALAMLLRESFGLSAAAARIEAALELTLREGWRTADIRGATARVVGTRDLARQVALGVERLSPEHCTAP